MAEGLLRARYGDRYEVFSAGTHPSRLSSRAIQVMQEIGIDISGHRSKHIDEFSVVPIDIVVTLCDRAHVVCPVLPHAKTMIHKGFADPHLTPGNDEEVLEGYRRVRDEIAAWIDEKFGSGSISKV
jgi:arsenate reductase